MKRVAIAAASVVALASAVVVGNAHASDPATNPDWDVNSTTSTISGHTNGVLHSLSRECDAASEVLVGGGVMINDSTSGTPAKGTTISTVYSAPQHSGTDSFNKDSWAVMLYAQPGTGSLTYSVTVYSICETF